MPPKPKYDQPKNVHIAGKLTQRGADWLEDNGGLDLIDQLAWGERELKEKLD